MAAIKQPILDIKQLLSPLVAHVSIWNNQLRFKAEGKSYLYPTPAAFIEVVTDAHFEVIGEGVRAADLGFKIHLEHEMYDAADGTMDENLAVFDLRDAVIKALSYKAPSGCSALVAVTESQDYEHSQTYHYIIEFACNFIDTTAQKEYTEGVANLLQLNQTFKING